MELIGQFGIGLLSAFIVAQRSPSPPARPGTTRCAGRAGAGRVHRPAPAERALVGTTVTLYLQAAHTRYLDWERLRSIIRTYADFIGVPVYLDDDGEPANAVTAPWHRHYSSQRERKSAYYTFWEKKFLQETSLHVHLYCWQSPSDPSVPSVARTRQIQ